MLRLLLVGIALASAARAQAPLSTDRPDLTESPLAVPFGRVQLETGATLVRTGGTTVLSGPEALVRWAPVRRAELRLALPDVTLAGDASLGALGVGGKVEVGTLAGADVGTIAMLAVPLDGTRVVPEVVLTAGRDVPFGSLGAQVSAAWSGGDPALGATLVAGRDLSARVGAFVELAVESGPGGTAAVLLHHGYTLALGVNAQADVHAGVGLAGEAPAVLVGVGWSRRW